MVKPRAMTPNLKKLFPRLMAWRVVAEAVGRGVRRGWSISHEHTNEPSADEAAELIENEVMNSLEEVIDFDGKA